MNITIGMFRVESLWAHLFGIPEWTANVTDVGKRKNSNIFRVWNFMAVDYSGKLY